VSELMILVLINLPDLPVLLLVALVPPLSFVLAMAPLLGA